MRKLALLALALAMPVIDASAGAVPRSAADPVRDYVLGRYAYGTDRLSDAARYFDTARRDDPADPSLARRTFELAIAAGDQKLAVALANQLAGANKSDSTVALIRLTDALVRRDWSAVDAARAGLADAGYAVVVGPIVEAWTLQGRGRGAEAIARLDPAKFEGFARSYATEHRAMLYAANHQYAAAAADYATLLASVGSSVTRLRIAAAAAQQAAGDRAGAKATLAVVGGDPQVDAASARLNAGRPIGGLDIPPRAGVAWLAMRLAADLAREKPVPLALVFARVATFLAPDNGESWLVAGDVLARGRRTGAAIAAYDHIAAGDPLSPAARVRRALALADGGQDADAARLLEAATKSARASSDDWVRLGDLDRKASRFADAAAAYDRALTLAQGQGDAGWSLYFLRGSAYEQAGDWARAEPDLRAALKLAPQEPILLNYLGYSLLDRGLKLAEAQKLIETAAKLKPDDGAIIDSLGWTYFRTGQFDQAVATLERAVGIEPGDPSINDHLGDAYWRVGRRLEARFRWRAALDLGPAAPVLATLRGKLDYGLDIALAQAAAH